MFDTVKATIRTYIVKSLAALVASDIATSGLTAEDLAIIDAELGIGDTPA